MAAPMSALLCLVSTALFMSAGLVSPQEDDTTTKYPFHPHEHLEDDFHELETADDSNRLVDAILRHAYLALDATSVRLADEAFDVGHLLPDGKGTLAEGVLGGLREVVRKGDSQFYKKGDDITVKATLLFPEIRVKYNEASVQSRQMNVQGTLQGKYRRLLVTMEVSHHEREHTNKVDAFRVKGYRESAFQWKKGAVTGDGHVAFTTSDIMEEIRVPLLKAVERVLKKVAEDHVTAWR